MELEETQVRPTERARHLVFAQFFSLGAALPSPISQKRDKQPRVASKEPCTRARRCIGLSTPRATARALGRVYVRRASASDGALHRFAACRKAARSSEPDASLGPAPLAITPLCGRRSAGARPITRARRADGSGSHVSGDHCRAGYSRGRGPAPPEAGLPYIKSEGRRRRRRADFCPARGYDARGAVYRAA